MATTDPPIRPAATTACLRDGNHGLEVLLVRRSSELVFYGSAWAFPGGRVDPEDTAVGASPFDEQAGRTAAVREAQEETAVVLVSDALVPLSHWTTPPGRPRRFSTWFFLASATTARVTVDESEIDEHWWARPADALAAQHRSQITLPPPTFVTLGWLEGFNAVNSALAAARRQVLERFVPRVTTVDGHPVSLYQGDAGYDTGDPNAPGMRHRLWMRPEGWRYERP
ncbi:MAG: NUDIX hydrolase [Myxococcales bacterium]|nr:NUDIX hydrolase [Myxococcales bacterium]